MVDGAIQAGACATVCWATLCSSEINLVMAKQIENGIETTAVHEHICRPIRRPLGFNR
jgi:hypothetical protein